MGTESLEQNSLGKFLCEKSAEAEKMTASIGLALVGQLPTGRINVFSTASAQAGIYPVLAQIGHKFIYHILLRLHKPSGFNGIVFNHIYQVGWHLPVYFYKFIGIFQAVIEILEQNVFKRDFIAGLFPSVEFQQEAVDFSLRQRQHAALAGFAGLRAQVAGLVVHGDVSFSNDACTNNAQFL